jgi:hypothetical protein
MCFIVKIIFMNIAQIRPIWPTVGKVGGWGGGGWGVGDGGGERAETLIL